MFIGSILFLSGFIGGVFFLKWRVVLKQRVEKLVGLKKEREGKRHIRRDSYETCLLYTSRVSELLGIRVDDLNHERSSLKLKRLKRRKEFLQDVPVPPELMNELKLFVRAKQRRGRVFNGDRFSAFRIIRTLGRRVLGRSVAPKHFRHGRAYHLVTVKNVHPIIASRALGHASMSSILSYVHPSEQDLRVALED